MPCMVQSGSWIASDPSVDVDTKWGGAKGFFSGAGLFLIRCTGQGHILASAYGAILTRTLAPGEGYTLDTGHIVAFDESVQYSVSKAGNWKTSILGGEGLVSRFVGPGRLWLQTAQPHRLRRVARAEAADAARVMPGSPWYMATVVAITPETARAKTFRLQLPAPIDFLAGQHVVVRLTAPDGYTAQRSYSVASAPDGSDQLELTVERLEDGEVSSVPARRRGGRRRARGARPARRVLRVGRRDAGAAGRRRVRDRAPDVDAADRPVAPVAPISCAWSCRRAAPTSCSTAPSCPGPRRRSCTPGTRRRDGSRAAARLMADDLPPLEELGDVTAFVCGSTGFCNTAGDLLVAIGQPVDRIKVERFGPSG